MLAKSDSRLRDRRGVVAAFVALLLFVFLGMAALAVDFGMLLGAKTEAQRTADGSAIAGALELYATQGDEAAARAEAAEYGLRNTVRGEGTEILAGDVDVEMNRWLVRVRVFRTQERGSAMANFFARAIGFPTSDVSTVAAARMAAAAGTNCLLPFVIPDRWWTVASGGTLDGPFPDWDDVWEEGNHSYTPLADFDTNGNLIRSYDTHSGYNDDARGVQIRLREDSGGGGQWNPATYFPIRFPGQGPGARPYEDRIRGCPDPETIWYPGMEVDAEPGAMVGPTRRGFDDLEALAPNHSWNSLENCVWDGAINSCINPWSSPRTRVVAMMDPSAYPANPSVPYTITNFAGVFYEGTFGGDIVVRFVEYRGAEALPPDVDDSNYPALLRILQLVE